MVTSLILLQIILPLALIVWFAIGPQRNRLGFIIQALVTAVCLFALSRMGLWILPPWWAIYLYGMLFVLALGAAVRRHWPKYRQPSTWLGWLAVISWVVLGVVIGNAAVQSWLGQFPPSTPIVDLRFPLQGRNYLIVNGGYDRRINPHMKTLDQSVARFQAYRGNSYAIDIIQTDFFGLRAKGLLPANPQAYKIYGEPVFAPCDGQVISAVDGFPDMQIPAMDMVNRSGNHVILRCDHVDILLAHFRLQSLGVKTDDQVKVGDRLAEVGNSGASGEPHLHIHAQKPGPTTAPLSGDPLPIKLDGRYPVRGDRFSRF